METVSQKPEAKKVEAKEEYELSHSAVARIVKKSGADRIGADAVDAIRALTEEYIAEVTKRALAAANHAGRKVIRPEDVEFIVGTE
jgi:histone H3/H4